jgi:hypothetical protein
MTAAVMTAPNATHRHRPAEPADAAPDADGDADPDADGGADPDGDVSAGADSGADAGRLGFVISRSAVPARAACPEAWVVAWGADDIRSSRCLA